MNEDQIAQIPTEVLDLLVDFAVYVAPNREAGNIDDEVEVSRQLDTFLRGYKEKSPLAGQDTSGI
jgi:hypothetical protein